MLPQLHNNGVDVSVYDVTESGMTGFRDLTKDMAEGSMEMKTCRYRTINPAI